MERSRMAQITMRSAAAVLAFNGTPGQISLYYLTVGREKLPRELALERAYGSTVGSVLGIIHSGNVI